MITVNVASEETAGTQCGATRYNTYEHERSLLLTNILTSLLFVHLPPDTYSVLTL